ncbi:WcbI family polysaccharide biosynthesis putative acetyltransferase [Oleidesulfovibrio sp.]|uniref:WcbI family polysaccharide biosynthesis putative acetyltransferase n=1 Tax=Oleidesulfovibrio sp. TaxID=2909707 RepID=UPI003A895A83
MQKELCLIHANCQGDPLATLLMASPAFARRFEIRKYTNYQREPIAPHELSSCTVFLYQHLGEKWAEHASGHLLGMVNPSAQVLRLPNMFFKGYWPLWTNQSPSEFGDIFLDHLIDMGLEKKEILYVYLNTDLTKKYDLGASLADSLAVERDKEAETVVQTVDMVEALWRDEMLFNTINHPGRKLLLHMADGVLGALGFPPLSPAARNAFADPYPEFILPIHPQVAAYHGLPFGVEDWLFPVFGKQKTFAQYAEHYVDCRLLGIESLSAYLHLV